MRLELENQRLQRELEAAKADLSKVEKNSAYELELGTRRVTAEVGSLEEQARRDTAALEQAKQEVLDLRRGREELETVVETLKQQHRNLQIKKDIQTKKRKSEEKLDQEKNEKKKAKISVKEGKSQKVVGKKTEEDESTGDVEKVSILISILILRGPV